MDCRRLYFDPSANSSHGNMLFLGTGNPGFRGQTLMMSMEDSLKGRPLFFSSSSELELYDDEYYDEQLPEKKRRLTPEQVVMLEKSFETENKLEPERKTQLAKQLGLQPRQVAVWFQNRRARWKTKQLEREFQLLKSSYDALFANCESITKENDRLRNQRIKAARFSTPVSSWSPTPASKVARRARRQALSSEAAVRRSKLVPFSLVPSGSSKQARRLSTIDGAPN